MTASSDGKSVLAAKDTPQPSPLLAQIVAPLAHVPGRVVFLAAMAAQMPEEEGGAAVMLVNDLAAVDPDLPLRALQAALRD